MDDADGGLRGLRARPGPGLLRTLQDLWGLEGFAEAVDLGGSSSLNLLVGDADPGYVVRVHRPHVTPERLGAIQQARRALLAHTHNLLWQVEVGEEGRRPRFANHLEPAEVRPAVHRGTKRIRAWRPTPAERRLAAVAEELAELVTEAEAGLVSRLPRQLVHGDFWDNNVLFRHRRPVLVADFDFMGERARIDDLALTLWCARSDLDAEGSPAEERARLGRLAAGYDAGLDLRLSVVERAALPVAMARQPLSSIGVWVARLVDEATARRHAANVASELAAARQLLTELGRWRDAFT